MILINSQLRLYYITLWLWPYFSFYFLRGSLGLVWQNDDVLILVKVRLVSFQILGIARILTFSFPWTYDVLRWYYRSNLLVNEACSNFKWTIWTSTAIFSLNWQTKWLLFYYWLTMPCFPHWFCWSNVRWCNQMLLSLHHFNLLQCLAPSNYVLLDSLLLFVWKHLGIRCFIFYHYWGFFLYFWRSTSFCWK